jgi:hypothetical protein
MTVGMMVKIEFAGIRGSEPLHGFGQVAINRLQKKVIMVVHKYISIDLKVKPFGQISDQIQKQPAIIIGFEDVLPGVATGHYMIKCSGIFYSPLSRHVSLLKSFMKRFQA